MTLRLETSRLILRTLDEKDIPGLLDFYERNRNFLKPWIPKYEAGYYTPEYQLKKLEFEKELRRSGGEFRFLIYKKDEPEKNIGNISVSCILRGVIQSAFLGYSIDEKENGKGFATEAVKKIIEFAFGEIRLHRLEANVIPANNASIRVLKKLKFVKEGYSRNYLKIDDKWQDHIRFAIINDNYETVVEGEF